MVERAKGFASRWLVHAAYRPTVTAENPIVQLPEFREVLVRFSPADPPIREMAALEAGRRIR